jgi:hypothetical protein
MSNEQDKIKHSKRLHKEESAIKKQVKIAKEVLGHQLNDKVIREPHRLAKHHVANCGDPKCVLCMNPRKSMGEKTIQEQRFEQDKFYKEEN